MSDRPSDARVTSAPVTRVPVPRGRMRLIVESRYRAYQAMRKGASHMNARSYSYGEAGENALDRFLATRRRRQVAPYVPEDGVAVDLGCGHDGNLLAWMAPRLRSGVGFDVSVRERPPAPNIQLHRARVDGVLPLPDASVDLVTCLAVIEHVERPDVLLREAHRLLRPDGVLVVTTPAPVARPILELMALRLRMIDAAEILDHKRYYSPAGLRKALITAGFRADRAEVRRFELGLNLTGVARATLNSEVVREKAPVEP